MNDLFTANTQEEAQGVEAKDHISQCYIYYAPNQEQILVVNEQAHINIINEDNYLNTAIDDLHNANAALQSARDACLQAIDDAPSPEDVNPSYYQRLVEQFDAAQLEAKKKREIIDKINETLDSLAEPEVKPIHQVAAITELIPFASSGGLIREEAKIRYVRPNKALAQSTGAKPVLYSTVDFKAQQEQAINEAKAKGTTIETNFLKDGQFNSEVFMSELKRTLSQPEIQSKIEADFNGIIPQNLRIKTEFLTEFAKNWSEASQYSRDKEIDNDPNLTQEEKDATIFSFDASAQYLRWTHGVGLKGDFDIRSLRASLKAEGISELAVLEGKADFKWQIPDRRGWMLSLPSRKGVNADLGFIRIVFQIILKGFVGATLAGEASIEIDPTNKIKGLAGYNSNPAPEPLASPFDFKKFADNPQQNSTANLSAGAGVFIGAEGTGEFNCAIQWKNPEGRKEYVAFAQYLIGVSGQAGLGGQAKFAIGYREEVGFYIEACAGMCFGYGAKGYMKFIIDATLILEFLAWVSYQLCNVDFQYIREYIQGRNTFGNLCALQYILIAQTYVGDALRPVLITTRSILDAYTAHSDRIKLMYRLHDDPKLVKHALPEVKGNIIYLLTDINFFTKYSFSADKINPLRGESWQIGTMKFLKRVVLNILQYTQSKREYENIMQFMSLEMGVKGDWQANEKKLLEFFDATEINFFLFKWASSDYDGEFKEWLNTLPADVQNTTALSFYEQLPDKALRGVDRQQTILANQAYCNGDCSNYRQPSYTAPEFFNCNAQNAWECRNPTLTASTSTTGKHSTQGNQTQT